MEQSFIVPVAGDFAATESLPEQGAGVPVRGPVVRNSLYFFFQVLFCLCFFLQNPYAAALWRPFYLLSLLLIYYSDILTLSFQLPPLPIQKSKHSADMF